MIIDIGSEKNELIKKSVLGISLYSLAAHFIILGLSILRMQVYPSSISFIVCSALLLLYILVMHKNSYSNILYVFIASLFTFGSIGLGHPLSIVAILPFLGTSGLELTLSIVAILLFLGAYGFLMWCIIMGKETQTAYLVYAGCGSLYITFFKPYYILFFENIILYLPLLIGICFVGFFSLYGNISFNAIPDVKALEEKEKSLKDDLCLLRITSDEFREQKNAATYDAAVKLSESDKISYLNEAMRLFTELGDHLDSPARAEECEAKIAAISNKSAENFGDIKIPLLALGSLLFIVFLFSFVLPLINNL